MGRTIVALGGNALAKAGEKGTWEEAKANMEATAEELARISSTGEELILTHGNGPQVGSLLVQQEAAKLEIPPLPMSALGAMTQGWIGYLIEETLPPAMARLPAPQGKGVRWPHAVLPLVTRVRVDPKDPSFRRPTKPVGPYYSENEARLVHKQKGWVMVHDMARGGWRRVVPSPRPLEILEGGPLRRLLDLGLGKWAIPVVAGGGGVPVVARRGRVYEGVEAVIDKDRTAALLGLAVGASTLAIVTDVPGAAIGFRTANERTLGRVSSRELRGYLEGGQFGEGSMRPKVEAALEFVEGGGERAIITNAIHLTAVIKDGPMAGTRGTILSRTGS